MADFFSNLFVRSNTPALGAVLQPRLPSLFESPYGADKLPTPPADATPKVVRQAVNPASEPVSPAPALTATPHQPRENEPPVDVSRRSRRSAEVPALPERAEQPERTVRVQPDAKPAFQALPPKESLPVTPPPPAGVAAARQTEQAPTEKSRPEPAPTSPNSSGAGVRQTGPLLQPAAIRPTADASTRTIRPDFKTGPTSQMPVLVGPPAKARAENRTGAYLLEERETVVQVHIGRIEVRAVTPPAAPRPIPTPVAQPRVSLDDYLRQREEKR